MQKSTCTKCGSDETIPGVKINDRGPNNTVTDFTASVQAYPAGLFFSGTVSHQFHVRVCGHCGYTEFYIDKPQELLAKAKKFKGKKK